MPTRAALALILVALAAACPGRAPCAAHGDCADGVCQGGRCEPDIPCNVDDDCPALSVCLDGRCAGGGDADDDAGGPGDGGRADDDAGGAGGDADGGGDAGGADLDGGAPDDDAGGADDGGVDDGGADDGGADDDDAGDGDDGGDAVDAGADDGGADDGGADEDAGGDAGPRSADGGCIGDVVFDDFDDVASLTPPWASVHDDAGILVEADDVLRFDLVALAPSVTFASVEHPLGDARGRRATAEVAAIPAVVQGAQVAMTLRGPVGDEHVLVVVEEGYLFFQQRSGVDYTTIASGPFGPAHRWLRLAASSTDVTLRTSPDGVEWTTYGVSPTVGWLTDATLELYGGTYQPLIAPGTPAIGVVLLGRDCP